MITLSSAARNESTTGEADLLGSTAREPAFIPAVGMEEFRVFNRKEYDRRTAAIDLNSKLSESFASAAGRIQEQIRTDSDRAQNVYEVVLLPPARSDLDSILDEFGFLPEQSAKRCSALLRSAISGLAAAPERYRVLSSPLLSAEGCRAMAVGGYLVLFTIGGDTVQVHRILFEKDEYRDL